MRNNYWLSLLGMCQFLFILCKGVEAAPNLLNEPSREQISENSNSEIFPRFDFGFENWHDEDRNQDSIMFAIYQSLDGIDQSGVGSNEDYSLDTEPGSIILRRSKRGIKRKNHVKRRRVARLKNRSANLTKQQLRSSNKIGVTKGDNNVNIGKFNSNFLNFLVF